jgi:two-component system sensor histidine kinase DesK
MPATINQETGLLDSFTSLKGLRRIGANYIWLMYSVFFFVEPILRRNATYWIENLAIFAVFLAIYVCFVETKRLQLRLPLVGLICLMGVLTIHFNDGASYFFIFAGAWLPFAVESLRTAAILLCSESLLVGAEWLVLRENPINFAITAGFVLVVGGANSFMAEQKRADCKLRAAQEENAALAAVAERERIARDLHDVLGHTLSVIVLKAELAGRLLGKDNARAASEIADVEKTARTALAEVREAIGGYRTKGLQAEVEQARRTLDAAGVLLECGDTPPQMAASEETVLSLAVREAVTNIVRHAGATLCTMQFAESGDGFRALIVADNGRGAGGGEGNGLRGMRERVQALGGRFRVESSSGTRVVIELPAAVGRS